MGNIRYFVRKVYAIIPFKKYFFLLLRKVWIPQKAIYQHLHFHGCFDVPVKPGVSFKIHHFGQQIENELFWRGLGGGWERKSLALWIPLCLESKVIFDVGANTGIYSLVAKAVNPNSRVFAFEPVDRVFERLSRNNRINDFDIMCEKVALSNYDGTGFIYDTCSEHILSVTVNKNLLSGSIPAKKVSISTMRLESYLKEKAIEKIDLIKIDVETHEPEVLEGLGDFLRIHRPTILVEVLSDEVGKKIETLIEGLEYLSFDIDENGSVNLVTNIRKSTYYNYLLCSREKAKRLKLNFDL